MEPSLREQIMINQFVMAVGSTREQARQLLQSSSWQFETALSTFFQEAVPNHHNQLNKLCAPANTPATPPSFPDAISAFGKLSTQERDQPSSTDFTSSPQTQCGSQTQPATQTNSFHQPSINNPFAIPVSPENCSNGYPMYHNNR